MKRAYGLDEVLLKPQYSSLPSRSVVDLSTYIHPFELDIPLISAPMSTVTEYQMALGMARAGGLGIIHRYVSVKGQAVMAEIVYEAFGQQFSLAINTDWERTKYLIDNTNTILLTMDIAHGHTQTSMDAIQKIKDNYPDIKVIGANIVDPIALIDLAEWVDGVRIGIGEGSACITRQVAGTGVPLATALMELYRTKQDWSLDVALIVDGGVKNTGDIVKCLALGADAVITGSLLVGTNESSAKSVGHDLLYKEYFGMGSKEAMAARAVRDPDFKMEDSIHISSPEGHLREVPRIGPLKDRIAELVNGIKIGFAYQGARNIEELREGAEFVHVSNH